MARLPPRPSAEFFASLPRGPAPTISAINELGGPVAAAPIPNGLAADRRRTTGGAAVDPNAPKWIQKRQMRQQQQQPQHQQGELAPESNGANYQNGVMGHMDPAKQFAAPPNPLPGAALPFQASAVPTGVSRPLPPARPTQPAAFQQFQPAPVAAQQFQPAPVAAQQPAFQTALQPPVQPTEHADMQEAVQAHASVQAPALAPVIQVSAPPSRSPYSYFDDAPAPTQPVVAPTINDERFEAPPIPLQEQPQQVEQAQQPNEQFQDDGLHFLSAPDGTQLDAGENYQQQIPQFSANSESYFSDPDAMIPTGAPVQEQPPPEIETPAPLLPVSDIVTQEAPEFQQQPSNEVPYNSPEEPVQPQIQELATEVASIATEVAYIATEVAYIEPVPTQTEPTSTTQAELDEEEAQRQQEQQLYQELLREREQQVREQQEREQQERELERNNPRRDSLRRDSLGATVPAGRVSRRSSLEPQSDGQSIDAAVSGQEPSAPRGSKWAQKAALRKQTRQTQPPPTAVSELAKPAVNPVFEPPPKPARKPQLEDSTPIVTQTPGTLQSSLPPPLPPPPNPLSAFPLPNQPAFQPPLPKPLPQSHSEQSRDFTQPTPMPAPPSKPPQETKTAKKSASGELGPLPNSFDYLLLTPDIVADRVRKRNYPIPFPIFCVMWTKSDTILVGGGGGRPGTGIPSGALVCDIKKELPDPRSPLYDNGWSVVPYAEVDTCDYILYQIAHHPTLNEVVCAIGGRMYRFLVNGRIFESGNSVQADFSPDIASQFTSCLRFSRDGARVATGGEDRRVRVWSYPDLFPVCALGVHSSALMSVDFSSDGRRVCSAAGDKKQPCLRVWNVDQENPSHGYLLGSDQRDGASDDQGLAKEIRHKLGKNDMEFRACRWGLEGPAECILAIANAGPKGPGYLAKFDATSFRLLKLQQIDSRPLGNIETSPTRELVAVANNDGGLWIVDVKSFKCLNSAKNCHSLPCTSLAWSPDSSMVCSASADKSVVFVSRHRPREQSSCWSYLFLLFHLFVVLFIYLLVCPDSHWPFPKDFFLLDSLDFRRS